MYNIIKSRVNSLINYFIPNKYLCSIEEIDTIRHYFIINSKWIHAPIKLSFNEIIYDYLVVSNLSPIHASWVGYYYGLNNRCISENEIKSNQKKINFYFRESEKEYKLISQDRHGYIRFLNQRTSEQFTASLNNILSNIEEINKFDSIQACYLGMLWGIRIARNRDKKTPTVRNAYLALVK